MNYFRFFFILGFLLYNPLAHSDCLNGLDSVFNQGKEYFSHEQYLLATQQFSLFSLLNCSTRLQDIGRVRWAQSLYELSENSEADSVLQKIQAKSELSRTAKIIQAWYEPDYIPSLSTAEQQRFHDWKSQVSSIPRLKNPWIAGSLSAVLPGAGQVYNGTYQSALFSFVLNALFLSATVDFHNKQLDMAAITSGVLFSVVYVGNILGAANTSRTINEKYRKPQESDLKKNLFPELSP